jgi:hypothetical protein
MGPQLGGTVILIVMILILANSFDGRITMYSWHDFHRRLRMNMHNSGGGRRPRGRG